MGKGACVQRLVFFSAAIDPTGATGKGNIPANATWLSQG